MIGKKETWKKCHNGVKDIFSNVEGNAERKESMGRRKGSALPWGGGITKRTMCSGDGLIVYGVASLCLGKGRTGAERGLTSIQKGTVISLNFSIRVGEKRQGGKGKRVRKGPQERGRQLRIYEGYKEVTSADREK